MGKLVDYKCRYADFQGMDAELMKQLSIKVPDVFRNAVEMSIYAEALMEKTGVPYCKLPFDTFAEGEAMGAQLIYDDSLNGPRKGADLIKDPHELLQLPLLDPGKGRIPEIFKACDYIRTHGSKTIIEVRGLFDVLNSLADIQNVMMLWIKEPEVMQEICGRIQEGLLNYIREARRHCDMLFYSDASGGLNVIGPRFGKQMVEWFTYPFMKDLQEMLSKGPKLQMCPKTSLMLAGCDKAYFVEIPAPPADTYAESCMALPDSVQFIGQRCSRDFAKDRSDTIMYMELY